MTQWSGRWRLLRKRWSIAGSSRKLTAALFGVRRAVSDGVNGVAARVWHLVNLPAGTDVHRLRKQIGALDRDVRRLTLQLELEQAKTTARDRRSDHD